MTTMRWAAVVTVMLGAASVDAPPAAAQTPDLTRLSLEDLLNTEITSVSRKQQMLRRTAAAVYVITQEDIRRSGATTIPDVLRLVPGYYVGQLNATTWSVGARGFAGVYSNKLLVMIDGRSIYSQGSGGVNWATQLLPLDMVQQIEVVRGPGGSLWGANTVNGVINIITKPAAESQHGLVKAHTGPDEPGAFDVTFGSRVGTRAHQVTRARYVRRHGQDVAADVDAGELLFAGTRLDWAGSEVSRFSLDAALREGTQRVLGQQLSLTPPFARTVHDERHFRVGHAMFSWTRSPSARSETNLQSYYRLETESAPFRQVWHIADVDARQRLMWGSRQEWVAGVGYRMSWNEAGDSPLFRYASPRKLMQLATAFVQDEIAIARDAFVTAGLKLERNGDTGLEVQPSIRALWSVTPAHTVWVAGSRAVRTPNRFDRDLRLPVAVFPAGRLPTVLVIEGNPEFRSEVVKAFEAGYRFQRGTVSIDGAAFVGRYADLFSMAPQAPVIGQELGGTVLRVPLRYGNDIRGTTSGVEIAAAWMPARWWRLAGSYAGVRRRMTDRAGNRLSDDTMTINEPTPPHLWHVRTYVDLSRDLEASVLFYRAAALPGTSEVPSYNRLDARLAWRIGRFEIAGGVKNLLRDGRPEYRDGLSARPNAPVRTQPYAEVGWRF